MQKQSSGLKKIANQVAAVVTINKIAGEKGFFQGLMDAAKDIAATPEGQRLVTAGLRSADARIAPIAGDAGKASSAQQQQIRDALANWRAGLSPEDQELYDAGRGVLPVIFDRIPGAKAYTANNTAANAKLNEWWKKYLPQSYLSYTGGSDDPRKAPYYNFLLQEFLTRQSEKK